MISTWEPEYQNPLDRITYQLWLQGQIQSEIRRQQAKQRQDQMNQSSSNFPSSIGETLGGRLKHYLADPYSDLEWGAASDWSPDLQYAFGSDASWGAGGGGLEGPAEGGGIFGNLFGGGGEGAGSSSGMGGAGIAAIIAAAIMGQNALTQSTNREFEGRETGNIFTGDFMTEPWEAYTHQQWGMGPTAGEKFDAAIKNAEYGTALQRLPAAGVRWFDPMGELGYNVLAEKVLPGDWEILVDPGRWALKLFGD